MKADSQTFHYAALIFRPGRKASQSQRRLKSHLVQNPYDASFSSISTLELWVSGVVRWTHTFTSTPPKEKFIQPKSEWQCWEPEKDAINKVSILENMKKM